MTSQSPKSKYLAGSSSLHLVLHSHLSSYPWCLKGPSLPFKFLPVVSKIQICFFLVSVHICHYALCGDQRWCCAILWCYSHLSLMPCRHEHWFAFLFTECMSFTLCWNLLWCGCRVLSITPIKVLSRFVSLPDFLLPSPSALLLLCPVWKCALSRVSFCTELLDYDLQFPLFERLSIRAYIKS